MISRRRLLPIFQKEGRVQAEARRHNAAKPQPKTKTETGKTENAKKFHSGARRRGETGESGERGVETKLFYRRERK